MADAGSSSSDDDADLKNALQEMESKSARQKTGSVSSKGSQKRTGSVSSKGSPSPVMSEPAKIPVTQTTDRDEKTQVPRVVSTYENTDDTSRAYEGPIHADENPTYDDVPLTAEDAYRVNPPSRPTQSPPTIVHDLRPQGSYVPPKSTSIEITDRDPTGMNDDVKVEFDDIFAEPSDSHSFDAIWTTSRTAFTVSKTWCYKIMTAVIAVPCAIYWGLTFACFTSCYIWNLRPYIKYIKVQWLPVAKLFSLCVKWFCFPVSEACGKTLSQIRINFKRE